MSRYSIQKIAPQDPYFPPDFTRTSPAPAQIYVAGDAWADIVARPKVAIVGSRTASAYGRHVTELIATDLARAGVVIVSGLAIGIDGIAHRACLEAGGTTVAILPGSIQEIYPARHSNLAHDIIEQGGALLTEYPQGTITYPMNFVARNRLVAAFADITVISEASQKSGTMHTARFALELGKDILAVPGAITSRTSQGTHNLIRSGAGLVSSADDILQLLNISHTAPQRPRSSDPDEQRIIDLLYESVLSADELQAQSGLQLPYFNQILTMLEIKGFIRPLGNNQWRLQ